MVVVGLAIIKKPQKGITFSVVKTVLCLIYGMIYN